MSSSWSSISNSWLKICKNTTDELYINEKEKSIFIRSPRVMPLDIDYEPNIYGISHYKKKSKKSLDDVFGYFPIVSMQKRQRSASTEFLTTNRNGYFTIISNI